MYHVRRCFLFHQSEPWVKKDNPEFDVPQGAFDSAEVSDLCGLHILHKLREEFSGIPVKALREDVFYRMGFNDQEIVALSGARASEAPATLPLRPPGALRRAPAAPLRRRRLRDYDASFDHDLTNRNIHQLYKFTNFRELRRCISHD